MAEKYKTVRSNVKLGKELTDAMNDVQRSRPGVFARMRHSIWYTYTRGHPLVYITFAVAGVVPAAVMIYRYFVWPAGYPKTRLSYYLQRDAGTLPALCVQNETEYMRLLMKYHRRIGFVDAWLGFTPEKYEIRPQFIVENEKLAALANAKDS